MLVSFSSTVFAPQTFAAIILALLGSPAWGAEIPFSEAQSIGAAVRHGSLVDIDGDGDLDLLGETGSEIAWFEDGEVQRTVGASAAAGSAQAADLDGDADFLDADELGELEQWQNLGDGGAWSPHDVATSVDAPSEVWALRP